LASFFFLLGFLSGCSSTNTGDRKEELVLNGFAFDTTYTITLYRGGSQELLDSCVSKCAEYETVFSRTQEGSELYQINEVGQLYQKAVDVNAALQKKWKGKRRKIHYDKGEVASLTEAIDSRKSKKNKVPYQVGEDGTISFAVSDMMQEILEDGLFYSEKSGGDFDITIAPLSSLWDFKTEKPRIPGKEAIQEALAHVGFQMVSLEKGTLTFQMPGMGIDLGGIAKGFIADGLKKYLMDNGVEGALINLGGNVLCIGAKEDGKPFHIGVQQPFAERNETVAAVSVEDMSVVSSGIYERYFETGNGIIYHHILNPKTGYPYDNDLLGVTILSEQSADGDGLSTACFALGKEEGMAFADSMDGVFAMFITKDGKVWYSEGFSDFLMEGG